MFGQSRMSVALIACCVGLLVGCNDDEPPAGNATQVGSSLVFRADLPRNSSEANIGASIYWDGRIRPLVGGDLFVASTSSNTTPLKSDENLSGFYQGRLPETSNDQTVRVEIQFDPHLARAGRWYDSQELIIEGEPGFLVGHQATARFPAETRLIEPAEGTRYRTRANDIILTWEADEATLDMRVSTQQRCYDDSLTKTWTNTFYTRDTGSLTIPVADLIPSESDINRANPVDELFEAIFITFIEILTLGLTDVSSRDNKDFRIDYCTIDINLFREIPGELGSTLDGGQVTGSTSDSIQVRYEP